MDHRKAQLDHYRPLWGRQDLAQAASRDSVTVVYKRMPRLFEELELAHGEGKGLDRGCRS